MEHRGLHPRPSLRDTADSAPLRSELAQDPDFAELLELFIHDLPDRIAAIQIAARRHDLAHLTQLARQFRTAARGYGFPAMTGPAARIETLARDACDIQLVDDAVDELLTLMRRATRASRE